MERMRVLNKYSNEFDVVFVRHIAQVYMERDDVVIRLDNGHRIYTAYRNIEDVLERIDSCIGANV